MCNDYYWGLLTPGTLRLEAEVSGKCFCFGLGRDTPIYPTGLRLHTYVCSQKKKLYGSSKLKIIEGRLRRKLKFTDLQWVVSGHPDDYPSYRWNHLRKLLIYQNLLFLLRIVSVFSNPYRTKVTETNDENWSRWVISFLYTTR